jgi:hypothetical protein
MAFTSEALNDLLSSLASIGITNKIYREAVKGATVKIHDKMALTLGSKQRKTIPVLRIVVEAIANKLFIERVIPSSAIPIDQWLKQNRFDRLERKLYSAAVRDGEAYLLMSWNNSTEGNTGYPQLTVRESFDGTCGAYVFTSSFTGEPEYAVNVWTIEHDTYLDVFYPGKIEKYVKQDNEWDRRVDSDDEEWPIRWTDSTGAPLGIPLIRFGTGESDIACALQVAKDLNEALIDLVAVSRTQGWPLRYLKNVKNPEYYLSNTNQPLLGPNGKPIQRGGFEAQPGALIPLQGENAEIGQLDSAHIDTALVDKYLELISWITTVPKHFFTGEWPSAVALIQAESRLNARVEDWQGELTSSFEELFKLMLRLSNTYGGTRYDPSTEWTIDWASPQVLTEDLKLDILTKTAQAITLLDSAGALSREQKIKLLHPDWTEDQIQAEIAKINAERQIVTL